MKTTLEAVADPAHFRAATDAQSIAIDLHKKLFFDLAKFPGVATRNDYYLALALAIRDRMLDPWVRSARTYLDGQHRTVLYLSAEYLPGPQLGSNVLALGIEPQVRAALEQCGLRYEDLIAQEEEPGLGNGGLGRLAACYMDSMATLGYPCIGHGIRYEFGIFDQEIKNGYQVERTDRWLRLGNPWETRRYEIELDVGFGGTTEHVVDSRGRHRILWRPARVVRGLPYDTVVLGYGAKSANFLRLWTAVAAEEFDLDAFQEGRYLQAVGDKVASENITKILYPNDSSQAGKELRLEQQYFFVSCALQDAIRLLLQRTTIDRFADKFAIQMNDTHPALAVAELMRLFVDVHAIDWDTAWDMTRSALAYTNHTLLPEALEVWPLPLMMRLLPRHAEIIFEINQRFLTEVRRAFPGDDERVARMSLIDEHGAKSVRMAHLATVGSHKVNGVAALHSRLLRETVLRDFAELWPDKLTNVTNGVTPRRFLALANPRLSELITDALGEGWLTSLDRLSALGGHVEDASFRERFEAVKRRNKEDFAAYLKSVIGRVIDPASLHDAQCKRIHEYKRQHLNLLHVVHLVERIRRGDTAGLVPRTMIFAGKAAPAYHAAKLIIRLATALSDHIERDPVLRQWLSVVFVPDYNVKTAQHIFPAADLSEQISTAGREASGTGNMKFAMNGALTIGTLDGANIEIRDAVGPENFFLFGLDADQVARLTREGYRPESVLMRDPELVGYLDAIRSGRYAKAEGDVFEPLIRSLVESDPFMVLA
ncbi:MAG: glycogen/starch/alpha-glucan phosphorylase, partial [Myxococcales bacterium]|nr:glycogen/starch/alpha-glucan phosphorylase [Myxococcales bacterium]